MSRLSGLNRGPTRYGCVALPTELRRHFYYLVKLTCFLLSGEKPTFLRSLTYRSQWPSVPFVERSKCRTKRITIWANKPQIFFRIIPPISIYVIGHQWRNSCLQIHFGPPAKTTLVIVFFAQILLYRIRYESDGIQTSRFTTLSALNMPSMLKFHLACVAAVFIK